MLEERVYCGFAGSFKIESSWICSMLAKGVVTQGTRGLHQIIQNRLLAGQHFDRCDHSRDDRQWPGFGAEMIFLGANHHAVKVFRALGLFLVVDDGIGADTLDLALQRPKDRRIIGGDLYDGVLVWTDKGDVLRADLSFHKQ